MGQPDDAYMTIADDNRREIDIRIEQWAHLCSDCVGFHRPRFQPSESHQIVSQILQTQLDFGIG